MRVAVMILAILGGVFAGMLGIYWMDDASKSTKLLKKNQGIFKVVNKNSRMGKKLAKLKSHISERQNASYLLFLTFILGIIGGVFAFRRQGKIAVGLLGAALLLPAFVSPVTLAINILIIIAACLSFFIKPEAAAVPATN